jgi:hypothetical protein
MKRLLNSKSCDYLTEEDRLNLITYYDEVSKEEKFKILSEEEISELYFMKDFMQGENGFMSEEEEEPIIEQDISAHYKCFICDTIKKRTEQNNIFCENCRDFVNERHKALYGNKCIYIFKYGPKKGHQCNRKCRNETCLCFQHNKKTKYKKTQMYQKI